jgi:AcrR family transcriptional regulator
MSSWSSAPAPDSLPAPAPRPYNSPLRRQRAEETRTRILAAGAALARGFPTWDWRGLTFRAVAERAEVSERTVYRHFATEQDLHRAVMQRLEEEAGVRYEGLDIDQLGRIAARVFAARASFAVPAPPPDPPFVEEDRLRRQALVEAISRTATDWTRSELEMTAAVLDVMWAVPAFDRLTTSWNLSCPDATRAVTWVIGLVVEAVQNGRRPSPTRAGRRAGDAKKRVADHISGA